MKTTSEPLPGKEMSIGSRTTTSVFRVSRYEEARWDRGNENGLFSFVLAVLRMKVERLFSFWRKKYGKQ